MVAPTASFQLEPAVRIMYDVINVALLARVTCVDGGLSVTFPLPAAETVAFLVVKTTGLFRELRATSVLCAVHEARSTVSARVFNGGACGLSTFTLATCILQAVVLIVKPLFRPVSPGTMHTVDTLVFHGQVSPLVARVRAAHTAVAAVTVARARPVPRAAHLCWEGGAAFVIVVSYVALPARATQVLHLPRALPLAVTAAETAGVAVTTPRQHEARVTRVRSLVHFTTLARVACILPIVARPPAITTASALVIVDASSTQFKVCVRVYMTLVDHALDALLLAGTDVLASIRRTLDGTVTITVTVVPPAH